MESIMQTKNETMRFPPVYTQIEDPHQSAVVDFLSLHFSVKITHSAGKVCIDVQAAPGKESSEWDEFEFEFDLPEWDNDEDEGEE
jgi:hypothetical protein